MILADAGADAGPLWLRIGIALVPPVLVAIITSYIAVSNTINRRAERLKNLNDIRLSNNVDLINPDCALERIMLRELKELDRATSPKLKWERRFRLAALQICALLFAFTIFMKLNVVHLSSHQTVLAQGVSLGIVVALLAGVAIDQHVFKTGILASALDQRYSKQWAALDQRTTVDTEASADAKP